MWKLPVRRFYKNHQRRRVNTQEHRSCPSDRIDVHVTPEDKFIHMHRLTNISAVQHDLIMLFKGMCLRTEYGMEMKNILYKNEQTYVASLDIALACNAFEESQPDIALTCNAFEPCSNMQWFPSSEWHEIFLLYAPFNMAELYFINDTNSNAQQSLFLCSLL